MKIENGIIGSIVAVFGSLVAIGASETACSDSALAQAIYHVPSCNSTELGLFFGAALFFVGLGIVYEGRDKTSPTSRRDSGETRGF
jgi:hypothetical protein